MLHWLAGQRQPDASIGTFISPIRGPLLRNALDPDATGHAEPPETPAPVFAVRAFKHAIFGTPQTAQPKARRNSTNENGRPRSSEARTARPGMNRPKSASDAQTLVKQLPDHPEPLASPTKGILLTPGTAGGKKKNVTFGDHVLDNEEKRPIKNDLSEDSPDANFGNDSDIEDELFDKQRGRGKLTEALEQVRDESRKRKSRTEKRAKRLLDDEVDVPAEFVEPKSESGKYWKREYDVYRTNTQREVKKLITKQKAAKSFAQAKDVQCTELADDLRQERKRADGLAAKIDELSTLMKDLHDQLKESKQTAQDRTDELATLKRQMGRRDSARPESRDAASLVPLERTNSDQRMHVNASNATEDPVQRPSEPYRAPKESEKPKMDLQTLRARVKPKVETAQPKANEDIWAQSLRTTSPTRVHSEKPTAFATGKPPAEPPTKAAALQSIDVNTLAYEQSPQLGEVDGRAKEDGGRLKSRPTRGVDQQRSPLQPSSESYFEGTPMSKQAPDKVTEPEPSEELSFPVSESTPQQHTKPAPTLRRTTGPIGPRSAPTSRSAQAPSNSIGTTKENVSPEPVPFNSRPQPPELNMKPSAMWTSINAPQVGTRNSSVRGKDGREVSGERLEAARARINARGRVAS
jgi:hypothetical protein